MSHFTIGVITPLEIADVEAYIERALAPFDENLEVQKRVDPDDNSEYWVNPDAKWDWWVRVRDTSYLWPHWLPNGSDIQDCESLLEKHEYEVYDPQVPTPVVIGMETRVFCPFAILEPDGKWSERGEMSWWATVIDEKPYAVWVEQVEALYAKYRDGYQMVLVDAHI